MTTFQIVTLSVQVRACHKTEHAKTETALPRRRESKQEHPPAPHDAPPAARPRARCPAAGQEPKSTATAVCQSANRVTSPTPDNGCNFGACKSLTSDTLTCAYDSSFCDSSTEEWMTAAEVIDAGEECKCTDILNYPSNIGTCSSSGVYSPMAVASDCSGGTAVCEADTAGHATGDTQAGVKQFTACDLPCSNSNDHTMDIATDTYTGCEFYQAQWATIAQAATGRMYPRSMTLMGNSVLLGAQIKSTTQATGARPCENMTVSLGKFNPARESTKMR